MKHTVIQWLVAVVALTSAFLAYADDSRQSVGLVLSGGGAKGIAHVGVLQAFEDNDIPIDYITGTSMGSIIGGLYASGYSPKEMMDLLLSRGFSYWSTGKIDPNLVYYFNRRPVTPAMFSSAIGPKSAAADSVPQSIISGQPMSFAFLELFSGVTARCGGDFNKLMVPYRCVASDPAAKHKHVFRNGRLGDAIRASMSFPIVFQPIEIDGVLYYDGGIYDNFPVDVMRAEFAPSIMIGVDVSTEDIGPQTTLMDQIENLVIQNNDYDLPESEGIKLRIDLNQFGLLDFPAAKAIYQVGYDAAMKMMDSIKTRVTSRTPAEVRRVQREAFKKGIPDIRFSNTKVYGASEAQNHYLEYLFKPDKGDTLSLDKARYAYYRALASDKLADFFPQAQFNPKSGLFDLTLKAAVKSRFTGAVGGYISSSTNSFLYLAADYSTLSFRSINTSLNAWIGQSTMAGVFRGRMFLPTRFPSSFGVEAVVSRERFFESDHVFFDASQPTFLVDHEYFGRLVWSLAAGRLGMVDIGGGYGGLRSSYYRNNTLDSYEAGKLHVRRNLGEVFVRYNSSTLDTPDYPLSGNSYSVTAMGVAGETDGSGERWAQLEAATRNYPALSRKFTLGVETNLMLSTRKLLPTYGASIVTAPGFTPTPATTNAFRHNFHADNYVAAGVIPVYKFNSSLSARVGGYVFMPFRAIRSNADGIGVHHGRWFSDPEAYAEADISFRLPFATLTGYATYSTLPGNRWSLGISFGTCILPPKFLR
ncbi:MAG: patatin-like phospholipase family protein [Muribaculaceae bacterium]|nr:patatin-like phospholipase family protein [Muribaculaceae bacterium]